MKLIQLKIKENVTARTIHTIEKHSVEIEITFTNNLPTCHLKRKGLPICLQWPLLIRFVLEFVLQYSIDVNRQYKVPFKNISNKERKFTCGCFTGVNEESSQFTLSEDG
jgi:hypothetical protein